MIGSREKIFATIRTVLADQVLTELAPKTWMAANIRACLTLLTYLEDKVANDVPALTETNAAIREFLAALAELHPAWLGAALQAEILAHPAGSDDIAALEAENETLKALLVTCIRQHRASGGQDTAFTTALRPCLLLLSTQDMDIAARAAAMPPF